MSLQVTPARSLFVALGMLVLPAFAALSEIGQPASPILVSDDGISLIDSKTLSRRWQRLQGEQTFEPAIAAGRILVSSSRGLYAIDRRQGDILWRLPDKQLGFTPVIDGDAVYLASRDGRLTAIDSRQGGVIWETALQGWVYPPALAGELLFTGGSDATLWAIERGSGRVAWSRPLGQEMVYSPVALADGRIVVTTFDREIISFNQAGQLLWRQRYPAILKTPIVTDEGLIFSGMDQVLRAVDGGSGRLLWQQRLPQPLAAELGYQRGLILAALENGDIWLIDSSRGTLQQAYHIPRESVATPRFSGERLLGFIHAFGGPKAVVATRLEQSNRK
ncbi:MAG: hypothetical protein B6D72_15770 [gamma proteobacterium symbiont of Ctena orbiculata]|uniref:PQQ-like beta-propeller repeat protein n=1 Tax=Candidatus Thiodiazotropha taylori TaxID=2792791 RepID=A0A944MAG5_9GAMM|nr:PQQ-like beta-propeller repeat protein [Candidatus Thiodiazotropha taylori]PUB87169.1 MAG: hypothetical protein DBP00_09185 [gamma proteobacterium symbiont of Ctena orbiculata]MBT2989169.1 PQQ-like beta-propeller repeat protein [Candidatus Thiodiazotropha taylori]MBT2995620.1 PQQ-like beta-propeller repeat protein [Candidatus Thiodiazotropha taylori]MBT2999426.1 PQQ-like beta-propeller repeat protein [Candidatus Thiodiazotropha taylori]